MSIDWTDLGSFAIGCVCASQLGVLWERRRRNRAAKRMEAMVEAELRRRGLTPKPAPERQPK